MLVASDVEILHAQRVVLDELPPRLHHVAEYLATEGFPAWSFSKGMGQRLTVQLVGDPFNLALLSFGTGLPYAIGWVEAIKLVLGHGDTLVGRLLAFDATEMSFREYKLRVDPTNEITWDNRDRITVAELDGLCAPEPLQAPDS